MEVELVIKVINELLVPQFVGIDSCVGIDSATEVYNSWLFCRVHTFKFIGEYVSFYSVETICNEIRLVFLLMGMTDFVHDVINIDI
jgi:hypothetical protein